MSWSTMLTDVFDWQNAFHNKVINYDIYFKRLLPKGPFAKNGSVKMSQKVKITINKLIHKSCCKHKPFKVDVNKNSILKKYMYTLLKKLILKYEFSKNSISNGL
jgi:hypothetical protein